MSQPIYKLDVSPKKDKKYLVITPEGKKIHFGANGYMDYIQYYKKNPELAAKRRDSYLKRHGGEDWTNLNKAGTWARYILWSESNLDKSIHLMEKKFNIKID